MTTRQPRQSRRLHASVTGPSSAVRTALDGWALNELRAAHRRTVAALIAQYPAQAQNAAYYEAQSAGARLGRMRSDVTTKGRLSRYTKGQLVLVLRDEHAQTGDALIWAPSSGASGTIVSADKVELR